MDLGFMRGLFGSSARAAAPLGLVPDPSAVNPNPDHSYLGGLIHYQRPAGQDDAERMALLGATLRDVGSSLRGADSDAVARTQATYAAARQRQALQAAQRDIADFASGRPINPRPLAEPAYAPPQAAAPADPQAALAGQVGADLGGQDGLAADTPLAEHHVAPVDPVAIPARSPIADTFGKPVTLANALPVLMHAHSMGVDIEPYIKAFQAANPTHQHMEGPDGLYDFDPATNSYKRIAAKRVDPIGLKPDENYYLPDDGSAPPAAGPGGAAPAAAPATAPATTPAPTGGVYDQVANIATQIGATPEEIRHLQRLAQVESNGDLTAQNGRSTGLFQFHPDTFAAAGGKNIADIVDQTKTALGLSRQYRATLQRAGMDPSDANTYLLHQQGPAGGLALLAAPEGAKAVDVLAPLYAKQFGAKAASVARQAIVNNGGSPDMTAQDFAGLWRTKWAGQKAAASAAPPAAAQPVAADPNAPPQIPGYRLVQKATPKADGELEPELQGLTGQDLMTKLKPAEATQVKALADGRMPFPSSFAISKPYWQRMLQLVAQYDPTFNAADYGSRSKTRADFTSGKSAQNITALNTGIGHMDDLDRAIDKLGNFGGFPGSTLNNSAAHFFARQSGTDQRLKDFEAARTAVANEMTRIFRGAGGAEKDVQGYLNQLDPSASPQSLRETVKAMASLLNSRLESLGEQYTSGMGQSKDPLELLHPDKAAKFARMMDGVGPSDPRAKSYTPATVLPTTASDPATARGGPANAPRLPQGPVRVNSPAEAAALKPGTQFVTPDGQTRTRR